MDRCGWCRRRQYVFNEVAALYDEVRPGYAPAIVDAVVARAGVLPGGRVLEIGCGTGQMTAPLAARGYASPCASNLATPWRRSPPATAATTPQVTILPSSFEAWAGGRPSF